MVGAAVGSAGEAGGWPAAASLTAVRVRGRGRVRVRVRG